MKCPFCGGFDSKVVDSRPTEDGERIRRRRECVGCGKRFTTFEVVEIKIVSIADNITVTARYHFTLIFLMKNVSISCIKAYA